MRSAIQLNEIEQIRQEAIKKVVAEEKTRRYTDLVEAMLDLGPSEGLRLDTYDLLQEEFSAASRTAVKEFEMEVRQLQSSYPSLRSQQNCSSYVR